MRKRLRDWGQRVFKFYAEPAGDLPETLWDTAHDMQALWNDLVKLRDETMQDWLPIRETATREEKQAFWSDFESRCKTVARDSGLNYDSAPAVLDRFMVTHRRCFKAPPRKDGSRPHPRMQHRLERVMLSHHYGGGGIPLAKLCSPRADVFAFSRFPQASEYTTPARMVPGRCRISGVSFQFRALLHRPVPSDVIVKRVAWCGERECPPRHDWRWSVAITVEEPPREQVVLERRAALDLGWRKFEDYIRIGMLRDEGGDFIELRLPLDMSTAQRRRQGYPANHTDLRELEGEIGNEVENVKTQLRGLAEQGLITKSELAHLTQSRQGALVRLLHTWQREEQYPEGIAVLERWRGRNDHLQGIYNLRMEQVTRRRQWYYRNLAVWLCKTFGSLAWEGDLSVKQMAEEEDKGHALDAADRYRQMAAIGELRLYLKEAAAKYGCTLVNVPAKDTTVRCGVCGALAESDAALFLKCPNGHQYEQDMNACRNLYDQAFPQIEQKSDAEIDLRKNGRGKLAIPRELQGVAIYVQSE